MSNIIDMYIHMDEIFFSNIYIVKLKQIKYSFTRGY